MRLYKRPHGVWYVEKERGQAKSLKTQDENVARQRFKEICKAEVADKLILFEKKTVTTVKEFLDRYDKWAETSLSYSTWTRIHRLWPKFMGVVGQTRRISSLKAIDLEEYIRHCKRLGNKPTTINIELRHIKAAFLGNDLPVVRIDALKKARGEF